MPTRSRKSRFAARRHLNLNTERLEQRLAFSVSGPATSFSAGIAEAGAEQPWIQHAEAASTGSVVFWLRVDVHDGVAATQTLPLWGRMNGARTSGPAPGDDCFIAMADITGTVFAGAGADPAMTSPMSLEAFGATPPTLHEGVQDYFLVVESSSDLALDLTTIGLVMAGAPGATTDTATTDTASTDNGSQTDVPSTVVGPTELSSSPFDVTSTSLKALSPLFASRNVPVEGFMPADAGAAPWLQDARGGETGSCVLWIAPPTAGSMVPRITPLFVRFNPQTDQDPAMDPPEDRHESSRFYPADGSDSVSLPSLDSLTTGEDLPMDGFLVLHSDSNFGLFMASSFLPLMSRFAPPKPGVALAHDTGASGTDLITSDGTLQITSQPDATVQYSTDGGMTWTTTFTPVEGRNTVQVQQVKDGLSSASTSFAFTLDTRAPAAPRVQFADGAAITASNPLRRHGELAAKGIEAAGWVEYSANGGPWTKSWTPAEGQNTVRVRQVDVAGNASNPTAAVRFQVKSKVDAPTVALRRDTGASATDRITSDPTLALGGVERNAAVQYSMDGGRSWKTRFAPVEGRNTFLVRQIDAVGNVSTSTSFTFTLDRTPPAAPVPRRLTSGVVQASSLVERAEPGARVEYSLDGRTWSTDIVVPKGRGVARVRMRAIDQAGNVSGTSVALVRRSV